MKSGEIGSRGARPGSHSAGPAHAAINTTSAAAATRKKPILREKRAKDSTVHWLWGIRTRVKSQS